jgi:hypothetical protein
MPDQLNPDFEHAILESDIDRLTAEVKRVQEQPENRGLRGEEIVKKSIQALPPTTTHTSQQSTGPLPAYASGAPPEVKLEIEHLLDVAFHEGILKANAAAQSHSPFVIDAFHDALTGKLYPELQRRGIVD